MEYAVELTRVSRSFGSHFALRDCSLTVKPGEFVTLLGASGCGKTTTIRIIAGYLPQTSGQVFINGREVSSLPPQKRAVGMVFQDYALFPHLTVRENIAFGLKVRRWSRARIGARVDELLEMTGLTDAGTRKPKQLSGGMQQRVAVARALAFQPQIMLMDEPLAALDVKLRETMQMELIRLQREVGVTTLYVTHDQHEAMSMSDRIVVMDQGAVQQIGTPRDIYAAPASRFVADFVGASNLLLGTVVATSPSSLAVRIGKTVVHAGPAAARVGAIVTLVLRPEAVQVSKPSTQSDGPNQVEGVIEDAAFMGSWMRLTIGVPELENVLIAQVAPEGHWQPGDAVQLAWQPAAAVWLAEAAPTENAGGEDVSTRQPDSKCSMALVPGAAESESEHRVNG